MKFIFLSALIAILFHFNAMAASLSVGGVANMSRAIDAYNPAPLTESTKAVPAPGGMIGLEIPFGLMTGLEIDAIYVQRKYDYKLGCSECVFNVDGTNYNRGELKTTTSVQILQVPVLLRFWIANFLTFGGGVYYSKYFGNEKSKATFTPNGGREGATSTTSKSLSAANLKGYDYGVTAALGFNFRMSLISSFFIEGRYNRSLVDARKRKTEGYDTKFEDIQAMIGFRFGT